MLIRLSVFELLRYSWFINSNNNCPSKPRYLLTILEGDDSACLHIHLRHLEKSKIYQTHFPQGAKKAHFIYDSLTILEDEAKFSSLDSMF